MKQTLRIANISGFYGDRLSAAQEILQGDPVDFLTGDYLAELTMAILYKAKLKNADLGYARTFLRQMEAVMGTCMERGIRVVVNAGGLNPAGLAGALEKVASELQLSPVIAYIEGDNLMPRLTDLQREGAAFLHLDKGTPLLESGTFPVTANAYLGCWGIVEALNRGADIVVTGRVADTSVVMGPAAAHFGWSRHDWDALAGAATAGHIIECSGQATGGNYSFFDEVPSFTNLGFPIAEIQADGSAVITKQPGTGGLVSVGTVTAQLMYEIREPAYITPDVVAHFDSIQLSQLSKDRVRVSGVKGSPATPSAKVTVNCMAGYQNQASFYIAGLDIERKVDIFKKQVEEAFGGTAAFDALTFQFFPTHKDNPASNEEAFAELQICVQDSDPKKAGKFFTSKIVELALCSIPGFCFKNAPAPARPRILNFPTLIDKKYLKQELYIQGDKIDVSETLPEAEQEDAYRSAPTQDKAYAAEATQTAYFGHFFGARSGDKGGNANLGVWANRPEAFAFLQQFLTVEQLKLLLPDTADFKIERHVFPNLLGLNFYITGFLGDGIAATTKLDGQAKTLGEYLRAKKIEVPVSLLLSGV